MKEIVLNVLYVIVLRTGKPTTFKTKVVGFPERNTGVYNYISKFENFAGVYFPYFTTFSTKLCNFTIFKMLFSAVVKDFVHLAWIKILVDHARDCPLRYLIKF